MTAKRRKLARTMRKRALGIGVVVALVVLAGCYAAVLELSRPHVSGDELRFDEFVALVQSGGISNAHILDADAYVVGSYVPNATPASGAPSSSSLPHDNGFSVGAGPVPRTAPGDTLARYSAPLLAGTQPDVLSLLLENGVPITV
jgi:hypothetical protein